MRSLPAASLLAIALAACAAVAPEPELRAGPARENGAKVGSGTLAAAPMTRPLASYVGRQIWVGLPGGEPEQWWLREVGGDHLTLERSRTYRVIPLRRVVEISWTDLTGIDPTPRVVVGPE
jgi:hypothetical protein